MLQTNDGLTRYQLATIHPFYNQDVFSVIMKFCMMIGVKTATMCASTHTLAWPFRKMINPNEMTHYFAAKQGFGPRKNWTSVEMWDEALAATLRHPSWRHHFTRHIKQCDVFLRKVIPVDSLAVLSMEHPTEDDYVLACLRLGSILRDIPKYAQTERIVETAVRQNGMMLQYAHIKTTKICWLAVSNDPRAFPVVPKNMTTIQICDEVAKRGYLCLLPKRKITQQRIVYAMNPTLCDWNAYYCLKNLLNRVKGWGMTVTVGMWKEAFGAYTDLYGIMHAKTKSVEFWIAAVESGLAKIGHVPVNLQPIVKMTCAQKKIK